MPRILTTAISIGPFDNSYIIIVDGAFRGIPYALRYGIYVLPKTILHLAGENIERQVQNGRVQLFSSSNSAANSRKRLDIANLTSTAASSFRTSCEKVTVPIL